MFTVKHRLPSGEETLYSVHRLIYVPTTAKSPSSPNPNADSVVLIFDEAENDRLEISCDAAGALVFVMNEHGATITKWQLGVNESFHRFYSTAGEVQSIRVSADSTEWNGSGDAPTILAATDGGAQQEAAQ